MTDFKKAILIFLAAFVGLIASAWYAQSATVTWENGDNPDLAGNKIYYGSESGKYGEPIIVKDAVSFDIELDPYITYYIAVSAYDLAGNESDKSKEVISEGELVPDIIPPSIPVGIYVVRGKKVTVIVGGDNEKN